MNVPAPHFLLFSESDRTAQRGQWRFVLQSLDGVEQLEAADTEPEAQGERLELLAVVRGLEAIPQPSRVTLVTPSRYVNRGLNYGLADWRSNDWQWEHFGEMAPVKNRDLWQRVDRALEFHSVECRPWQFEGGGGGKREGQKGHPEDTRSEGRVCEDAHQLAGPHFRVQQATEPATNATALTQPEPQAVSKVKSAERPQIRPHLGCQLRRRWIRLLRKTDRVLESIWLRLGQLGTRLLPPPWMN